MTHKQHIYVNEQNVAHISCPGCGATKAVPVERFRGTKHTLPLKCPCGECFQVQLDFRKTFRKTTDLQGKYRKSGEHPSTAQECRIIDLSMGGLKMHPSQAHGLQKNDALFVQFKLDDKNQSEIKRKIRISHVRPDGTVAGMFLRPESDNYDKAIGFYLRG